MPAAPFARLKSIRTAFIATIAVALGTATPGCLAQYSTETYPVRGVVLNGITHQPIARALVDGMSDAALTDNEGHFELNLSEGMTQIQVRRPGYGQNLQQGARHQVRIGPNMPELTFYLTPSATITGHALLADGSDAEDVRFIAYRKRWVDGRERWMNAGPLSSNSEGIFRLNDVAPGAYLLCTTAVRDRMGAAALNGHVEGYPSACFPGSGEGGENDASAATPLTITAGQQAELEITLTRQPFYLVSILMPAGLKGQRMPITIHDQNGQRIGIGVNFNEERGTTEAYLPNGNYFAEVHVIGKGSTYGRVDFRVENGPVTGLSLTPVPLHPLAIEVRKDFTVDPNNGNGGGGPGPIRNFQQANDDQNPGINFVLTNADMQLDSVRGGNLRHPEGSANGHFEMDDIAPGRYWVTATTYMGYVSSITGGGVDLTREPLVVGSGGSTAPIEITLRNDTGQIVCTVNQASAGGVTATSGVGEMNITFIYAIPLSGNANPNPLVGAGVQMSGQAGIPNISPGSYRVAAFDSFQDTEAGPAQILAKAGGKSQTVTVTPEGTATVQLDVVKTSEEGSSQ